jgi:5-(carboxyamino)imidazole ribonucleotide mutase
MPQTDRPLVAVLMGSKSDWDTMRHSAETLEALGIAWEARIVSAHRTPVDMAPRSAASKC